MSKIGGVIGCALSIVMLVGCSRGPSRDVETFSVRGVEFKMIKVKAGSLEVDERGRKRKIELTRDFYIGQTVVTQELWFAVMQQPHMWFKGGDVPAECVSWNDAMKFCDRLTGMIKLPRGWKFTLPTEAQWEFAARGGTKSRGYIYSGSNRLSEVCKYDEREDEVDTVHGVLCYKSNELGLYDMSGNVGEWCLNDYDGEQKNEFSRGNDRGGYRAYRGCSGGLLPEPCAGDCMPSSRQKLGAHEHLMGVGFRIVLVRE